MQHCNSTPKTTPVPDLNLNLNLSLMDLDLMDLNRLSFGRRTKPFVPTLPK